MKTYKEIMTDILEKDDGELLEIGDYVYTADPYGSKGSTIEGRIIAIKPGKVQVRLSTHKIKWFKNKDVESKKGL